MKEQEDLMRLVSKRTSAPPAGRLLSQPSLFTAFRHSRNQNTCDDRKLFSSPKQKTTENYFATPYLEVVPTRSPFILPVRCSTS